MKVLLDTTYLLPAVGIDVDLPEDLLEKLFPANHSFVINELSLFELFGKASRLMFGKEVNAQNLVGGNPKQIQMIKITNSKPTPLQGLTCSWGRLAVLIFGF